MSATDAAEKQAGGFSMLVGDGWNLVAYRCAWIAVVLSQLSLIALIQHPPLLDYPNHLARAYVLRHLVDVAAFQSTWQAAWAPLPNLAMDLVMLPLQPAFGIERAGKIFLCLTILIGHAGVHLLGKAIHGRPTWLALPAMFFVLNTSFLHGFVNYSFGLGLFLVAMAYWIPRRDTPSIGATIGGSLLALGCYLSHLSSIVFLALGVGTFVVADLVAGTIRRRTAILALLLFVVPLFFSYRFLAARARSSGHHPWRSCGHWDGCFEPTTGQPISALRS